MEKSEQTAPKTNAILETNMEEFTSELKGKNRKLGTPSLLKFTNKMNTFSHSNTS